MATITITDGDFGSDISARVGEDDLFLPDRARPGLTELVPLNAVAEIESIADDHSERFKAAGMLALRGASLLGPVGLAAGVLAVGKVKDVKFGVRLADGRSFRATADATTYASLRANFVRARGSFLVNDARADEVIEKYLKERKAAARAALADEAKPEPAPAPVAPVARVASTAESSRIGPPRERPAFGRRGR